MTELNQDEDPRLAAASGSMVLLMKVLFVISTASSTKLSCEMIIL